MTNINFQKFKNYKMGFVILFAVTLSAILLSVALGVSNIALKELKFGTNARNTNDAFLAADSGIECAFYYDREDQTKFPKVCSPSVLSNCASSNITPNCSNGKYTFTSDSLGSSSKNCAIVTVDKSSLGTKVVITSKGYSNWNNSPCDSATTPPANSVERELQSIYGSSSAISPPTLSFFWDTPDGDYCINTYGLYCNFITWSSTNTDSSSCSLTGGNIEGAWGRYLGSIASSGSYTVAYENEFRDFGTANLTITCTNSAGSISKGVSVPSSP